METFALYFWSIMFYIFGSAVVTYLHFELMDKKSEGDLDVTWNQVIFSCIFWPLILLIDIIVLAYFCICYILTGAKEFILSMFTLWYKKKIK